jgi:hypothetical protein
MSDDRERRRAVWRRGTELGARVTTAFQEGVMRRGVALSKWLPVIICVAGAAAAFGYVPERQIPVKLTATPKSDVYAVGESILVTLAIENGLRDEIGLTTFSLVPNDWNGETYHCSAAEIHREGKQGNLYLARPELKVPRTISGPSAHYIKPGESLTIELDLSKWQLRDGWLAGRYDARFRVDEIRADKYVVLAVSSDPITFELR